MKALRTIVSPVYLQGMTAKAPNAARVKVAAGKNSFKLTAVIPAPRKRVYEAWLDARAHSTFTGAKTTIRAKIGGRFTAWDGYKTGKTLELKPSRLIVQSWRTTEFPADAADSRVELHFEDAATGTRLTLIHSGAPSTQVASYKTGWRVFCYRPMRAWFSR